MALGVGGVSQSVQRGWPRVHLLVLVGPRIRRPLRDKTPTTQTAPWADPKYADCPVGGPKVRRLLRWRTQSKQTALAWIPWYRGYVLSFAQFCSTLLNFAQHCSAFLFLLIFQGFKGIYTDAQLCSTLLNFAQLCSALLNFAQLLLNFAQLCSGLLRCANVAVGIFGGSR